MNTSDFFYELPPELIAQTPVEPRDHSRLLVCGKDGSLTHRHFYDIADYLDEGDALVVNETRVIPARLIGERQGTGGAVEVLLLKRLDRDRWECLVRPGRKARVGQGISFGGGRLTAIVQQDTAAGGRILRFACEGPFEQALDELGQMPLPPYITQALQDRERYQTVYAKREGSSAAPTAGLHFTPQLMQRLRDKGVSIVPILLHVGLGTFRPVKAERIEQHVMHEEYYEVSEQAARRINAARAAGRRCVCVGTTCARTLESVADADGTIRAGAGETSIFIYPGYRFRAVDALITNFHLPESTLLMLVSALMGTERALAAYQTAVREGYRFFSFGDAMFIR